MRYLSYFYVVLLLCLAGCELSAINSPYPAQENEESILFTSFSLRPKHLDPARSYSSNEVTFTGQIYEPPLQYHYLKRPYTLMPLTATQLPTVHYFSNDGSELTENDQAKDVAYSVYEITIKPNISFQPHPAFVKDDQNDFLYHQLNDNELDAIRTLSDFEQHG
ncbi:MAG: peptide ABC transporter substrate-binding protein, partial [Gammaproteobacteria bacterium]